MEHAVKVYYARTGALSDGRAFEENLKLVQKQRRAKVLRCKNEADRRRSLAAGLLLRHGLREMGIAYETAVFGEDPCGKPYLMSAPALYFNLSHSGDYAACAFFSQEIGIDLECVSERFSGEKGESRMVRVADRIFSPQERAFVFGCAKQERASVFVKLWTRKECYAKACGAGIRMDFSSIDTLREERFASRRIGDCWMSVCAGETPLAASASWEELTLLSGGETPREKTCGSRKEVIP